MHSFLRMVRDWMKQTLRAIFFISSDGLYSSPRIRTNNRQPVNRDFAPWFGFYDSDGIRMMFRDFYVKVMKLFWYGADPLERVFIILCGRVAIAVVIACSYAYVWDFIDHNWMFVRAEEPDGSIQPPSAGSCDDYSAKPESYLPSSPEFFQKQKSSDPFSFFRPIMKRWIVLGERDAYAGAWYGAGAMAERILELPDLTPFERRWYRLIVDLYHNDDFCYEMEKEGSELCLVKHFMHLAFADFDISPFDDEYCLHCPSGVHWTEGEWISKIEDHAYWHVDYFPLWALAHCADSIFWGYDEMALFASYPISLEYAFGEDFADNYVRSLAANVTYDPLDLTDDVLDYLTIESTILFAFRINCSLLFLFLLLFCQILVLNDILLMVVLLDLCISFLSVLFLLLGGQKHDLMGALFFFLLISLAACETALSLGFLVSFSRRHSTLTSDSLRFLASS